MPCSIRRKRRAGITLVETVVGLTLLSTLLVGFLLSFRNHQEQVRIANRRLEAADIAEQLLARWMTADDAIPRNGSGRWNDRWSWRTRHVRRTRFQLLPLDVVALDIRPVKEPQLANDAWDVNTVPLVSIEIVDNTNEKGAIR